MNISTKFPTILFALLFITAALLAGCDNPASNDDEEIHADPEGLELVHNGEVIFEYIVGEGVTEHSHLHYHVGEEYLFEVHFLNEDGDHIHAEDLDEDYFLGWIIENEDILAIHQHDEDGRWNFHLEGLAEGVSKVQFRLMHGNDHSDLSTPDTNQEEAIEFHIDADGDGEHDH